jgi:hypothetical protein
MTRPTAMRFFWVVMRPSVGMVLSFAAFLGYASYLAFLSPATFDGVLGLAVLGQMIAASSGYRDRLVRGHFDQLLAGCRTRGVVALAHLAFSIAPGVMVWIALGAVDVLLAGQRSVIFTAGGIAGFLYVSLVAWAVSLRLGRNSGVLWIVGLFVLAAKGEVHVLSQAYGTSNASLAVTLRAAGAALVHPLLLVANGGHVEPLVLAIVVAATLGTGVAGVMTIVHLQAPLRQPA